MGAAAESEKLQPHLFLSEMAFEELRKVFPAFLVVALLNMKPDKTAALDISPTV